MPTKIYTVKITEANPELWYCSKFGSQYEATLGVRPIEGTADGMEAVFIVEGQVNTRGAIAAPTTHCILPTDCIVISEQLKTESNVNV